MARTLPSTGGNPTADGVNQFTTRRLIRDRAFGQVRLKQTHRALDIESDRTGIDVRGRNQDATNGSAVTTVGIGIQHDFGYTWCAARIDRLLQAEVVKRVANGFVAKHLHGRVMVTGGKDRGCITSWNDRMGHVISFVDRLLESSISLREITVDKVISRSEMLL